MQKVGPPLTKQFWVLSSVALMPWPHHCKPSASFPCIHHSAKITVQSVLPHRGQSSLNDDVNQLKSQDLANSGLSLRSFVVFLPVLKITLIVGLCNLEAFTWFPNYAGNSWADVWTIFCHASWIYHQSRKSVKRVKLALPGSVRKPLSTLRASPPSCHLVTRCLLRTIS